MRGCASRLHRDHGSSAGRRIFPPEGDPSAARCFSFGRLIRTTTQPAPSRFDDTKRACSLSTGWGAHHHASPHSVGGDQGAIIPAPIASNAPPTTAPTVARSSVSDRANARVQANWKLETPALDMNKRPSP
jgi:hypothetical protein